MEPEISWWFKSRLLDLALSQTNQVFTHISYTFKIYSTIILPSTTKSSKLPLYVFTGNVCLALPCISHVLYECYIPCSSYNLWSQHPNDMWWGTHCKLGRAMAQVVSRLPLTRPWSVRVGFVVHKVALGQGFLRVLLFSPSISYHHGYPYSYTTWGMNNSPAGGRSAETSSHPIDMDNLQIMMLLIIFSFTDPITSKFYSQLPVLKHPQSMFPTCESHL
jgi:hypothetical protein